MTSREAIASLLLTDTSKTWTTNQLANKVTRKSGVSTKTVQNMLGILISEGAVKRTDSGYTSRNKRKLSSYVA